jgi:hypothetical protein
VNNETRAQQLASAFRSEHGLGLAPLGDIFEVVHAFAGVDVLSMEASEAEHGLSMLLPASGRVVIAVATTQHPMRQRSSVAHELGHVLAGDLEADVPLTPGERTPEEIRADAFARHLLLPVDAVTARLGPRPEGAGEAELSTLVQEFEVSPQLAAIQLRDAGYITAGVCEQWRSLSAATIAARHGWLGKYRTLVADSMQPRAPQGLVTLAVEGYRRGVLGINELAGWYDQSPADLQTELGTPEQVEDSSESDGDVEEVDDDFWNVDAPLFADRPDTPAS